MTSPKRVRLCSLADLSRGRQTIDLGEDAVLVLVDRGTIHVLDAHCPHQYAPLHSGPIEAGVLVCPHHGWRFRLSDGVSPDTPCIRIRKWPSFIEDGAVWTEIA